MVIRDLKEPCTRCNGTGRLAGVSKLGIPQINVSGSCPQCSGRGFQLTSLGQDLLEVLRPFVEEWIEERAADAAPAARPKGPPGS
jgi:hypothetical protein